LKDKNKPTLAKQIYELLLLYSLLQARALNTHEIPVNPIQTIGPNCANKIIGNHSSRVADIELHQIFNLAFELKKARLGKNLPKMGKST
jgi:hypothetical protein